MTGGTPWKVSDALRWTLEASLSPSMAAADWLARDIDPHCDGAIHLLVDRATGLADLEKAKDAFKTLRVVGETGADRRLGAMLYAGAIAAGMVHHRRRISQQSDAAVSRALRRLVDDRSMPESLRTIAGTALCLLETDRGGATRGGAKRLDPTRPGEASAAEGDDP